MLTHFLFIVVTRGFSGLMREAMTKGMYKGYKMGDGGVKVNLV